MYLVEMTRFQGFVAAVGRFCLAMVFIFSGFEKMLEWDTNLYVMSEKGLPLPSLLLATAVVIELLGGFALLTGVMARASAMVLTAYLLVVTAIYHHVGVGSPEQMVTQLMQSMKNLSIMGGLFMVNAFGPGPLVFQEPRLRKVTIMDLQRLKCAREMEASPVPEIEKIPSL